MQIKSELIKLGHLTLRFVSPPRTAPVPVLFWLVFIIILSSSFLSSRLFFVQKREVRRSLGLSVFVVLTGARMKKVEEGK